MDGATDQLPTQTDRDVQARLERLENVEQICRLKAAYCAACDDDHNGDTVVGLFAPGGTWSTSLGTSCANLDEIRTYFGAIRSSGRMRYSTHMVTNPVVDVDGSDASATWSFAMMYTDQQGHRYRILGFYRDEFVEITDGWRFRSISSTVQDYVRLETLDIVDAQPPR
ncbi:nuclear transport factor 2 family protein [Ilumatobacter sp.]|uniref:nuclear transport factor 2 family protein n=1 Tax=Ilumatobacter sp. TaxID=1967498 RepID=UPI003C39207C